MTSASKQLTLNTIKEQKTNWRQFSARLFAKISENILDMVITIATVGMLIAYLGVTQPLAALEYSGYIIAIYLVILMRRIVHDFDDTYQINEIGSSIETMRSVLFDMYRASSNDNAHLTDEEIEDRFASMQ